jgi:hypothetical protein
MLPSCSTLPTSGCSRFASERPLYPDDIPLSRIGSSRPLLLFLWALSLLPHPSDPAVCLHTVVAPYAALLLATHPRWPNEKTTCQESRVELTISVKVSPMPFPIPGPPCAFHNILPRPRPFPFLLLAVAFAFSCGVASYRLPIALLTLFVICSSLPPGPGGVSHVCSAYS